MKITLCILVLLSSSLFAGPSKNLDLTIPKQPTVDIPERKFFFNWDDYQDPPTKAQMITFWTLHALDVYTTHHGNKRSDVYERNPLLPKKPKLEELILHKAIVAGYLSKHSSKRYITTINVVLVYSIINNYELYN